MINSVAGGISPHLYADVAQLAEQPCKGTLGRWFKSNRLHHRRYSTTANTLSPTGSCDRKQVLAKAREYSSPT